MPCRNHYTCVLLLENSYHACQHPDGLVGPHSIKYTAHFIECVPNEQRNKSNQPKQHNNPFDWRPVNIDLARQLITASAQELQNSTFSPVLATTNRPTASASSACSRNMFWSEKVRPSNGAMLGGKYTKIGTFLKLNWTGGGHELSSSSCSPACLAKRSLSLRIISNRKHNIIMRRLSRRFHHVIGRCCDCEFILKCPAHDAAKQIPKHE